MNSSDILLNFAPGDKAGLTFTRVSSGTAINALGQLYTANPNEVRIQYEDVDGDGIRETPGVFSEGSRTNVLPRSQELDNTGVWTWLVTGVVGANTTIAPDGTLTADTLDDDHPSQGEALINSPQVTIPVDTSKWCASV